MTKPNRNIGLIILLLVLAVVPGLRGATGTLFPAPWFNVLDANGNPVSGAKACFYTAGTSTPATTYSDVTLLTPNSNPVAADSAGRVGPVYLTQGQSYKLILQDATGTAGVCDGAVIRTQDNIAAVPTSSANLDVTGTAGEALTAGNVVYLSDGSGSKTVGSWYKADSAQTYSSTTPQIAMVPSAIASGSTGSIRLAGQVTGLTVSVGSTYYVGSSGAVTSTAPATNRRVLGMADSATSLVLAGNPQLGNGIAYTNTANAFGAAASLGLTDAFTLSLKTNNVTFLSADSSGIVTSATQLRASVFHSTTQSINNSTYTAVIFDSEDYDVTALHDTVTNNSRITLPATGGGLYRLTANIFFAANGGATPVIKVKFRKNGTTDIGNELVVLYPSGTGIANSALITKDVVLANSDYVEVLASQTSGGALNIGSATRLDTNEFSLVKLW